MKPMQKFRLLVRAMCAPHFLALLRCAIDQSDILTQPSGSLRRACFYSAAAVSKAVRWDEKVDPRSRMALSYH
jgi:hypothetical protein